jgi:CrcB protein
MTHILLAGLGGFVGAAGRYGLSTLTQRLAGMPFFPFGTLLVNVVGCLLIGMLAGMAEVRGPLTEHARVLLITGVLGGFTTFSAFGFETIELARSGRLALAATNVVVQLLVGLAAVWGGILMGRHLCGPAC